MKSQFSSLRIMNIAAVAAFLAGSTCAFGAISGFGNFTQWQINESDGAAAPVISLSPSEIHLTGSSATFETRSIFDKTPQSTSQFTASFTYQATGSPDFSGFAFVLEDGSAGAAALGNGTSGLGYGGGYINMNPNVAIEFPLYGGVPYSAGVFTSGNTGSGTDSLTDPTKGPINLLSGDPINITITYDGTYLSEYATDTVTGQTSIPALHINVSVPAIAYVGITASTQANARDQLFSDFQFINAVPEPGNTGVIVGGIGLIFGRRRR